MRILNQRAQEDNHLEEMVKQRLKLSAKIILDDLPTPEEEPYDEFPGNYCLVEQQQFASTSNRLISFLHLLLSLVSSRAHR